MGIFNKQNKMPSEKNLSEIEASIHNYFKEKIAPTKGWIAKYENDLKDGKLAGIETKAEIDQLIGYPTKEEYVEKIDNLNKKIAEVENNEKLFTRLVEKYRNNFEQRLNIDRDWARYIDLKYEEIIPLEIRSLTDNKKIDELMNIQVEEIENKFKKLLEN